MTNKADPARDSGRVSPTAPADHSASNNVWRMLESTPGFHEGMAEAKASKVRGEAEPFHHKVPRPIR